MNVFVKNLPDQMTEKQVENYFRPHLDRLGIKTYHCDKLKTKGCAILTILDIPKAERFLLFHGQARSGPQGFDSVRQKLFHMNRPVNCSPSNKSPDRFLVSSLEKEEKDRKKQASKDIQHMQGPRLAPRRAFEIVQLCCGQWDFKIDTLVFASCYDSVRMGRIVYDRKGFFIKLTKTASRPQHVQPTHFLQIPYRNVHSITIGSQHDPSITLSLSEPPKLYEEIDPLEFKPTGDSLLDSLNNLLIKESKPSSIRRKRISKLDDVHGKVVSSCLCYRFRLRSPTDILAAQKLKHIPEIPGSITLDTPLIERKTFADEMGILMKALGDYHKVPFEMRFQLQKLAQNGSLAPSRVHKLLQIISDEITDVNVKTLTDAVYQLYAHIPFPGPNADSSDLAVENLMEMVREKSQHIGHGFSYAETMETYEHIVLVHKATVTPTRVYLDGPAPEVKNRVLRKYAACSSYFLSVSFTDEDGDFLRYDRQTSTEEIYMDRFQDVLEHNIAIAGRLYQFLGFSHSSLRAHTCWYMAPFMWQGSLIHAQEVIKDLGDFSLIRSPAKCAARIGQAFSQTFSSINIPKSAIHSLLDVERNGRTFSDGVGTCSLEMMHKIWDASTRRGPVKPTIFQIRFQGAKGVISLDSRLEGLMLCLRPSMIKFGGTNVSDIEICGSATRPLPMYLNQQMIKILEDLGVEDHAFLSLQDRAVENLRASTLSPVNAAHFLQRERIGEAARLPWLVKKLWSMGLQFKDDIFLRNTMETAVLMQLRALKHRARILVENGVTLYGIMDETDTLEEGQIYCSIHSERGSEIITGDVVITRSPALHPGDIQCVQAVDVPSSCPLAHIHNVVVFSSKGQRDLPSQLSGGDLDGDIYNVIFDITLYPKRVSSPADYALITPIDIGREVEKKDITDHFRLFMQNDNLGQIATLHKLLADQQDSGTFSRDCLLLADLHSNAVDFSKTGIPVQSTSIPRYPKARPDFLAPGPQVLINNRIDLADLGNLPEPDETDDLAEAEGYEPPKTQYYESQKILGKLYRAIDEREFLAEVQSQAKSSAVHDQDVLGEVWKFVQKYTLLIQWEHHIETANEIKESYEDNLVDTMTNYSTHPLQFVSEIEVFAGCILGKNGAQTKRQREYSADMRDKHNRDVEYTIRCIKHGDEDSSKDEALERSLACLYVACRPGQIRPKVGILVSFAWVAAGVCLQEVENFLKPVGSIGSSRFEIKQ